MSASDYVRDIVTWEGLATHLYCDHRGNVTIGIGHYVPTAVECAELPLYDSETGQRASDAEKFEAWERVKGSFAQEHAAAYYRHVCSLRLSEEDAVALAVRRLKREFLPAIRKLCHDFDDWPQPARAAVVDIAWNRGVRGFAKLANGTLVEACQTRDWEKAAIACRRTDSRLNRNQWTAQQFMLAEQQEDTAK